MLRIISSGVYECDVILSNKKAEKLLRFIKRQQVLLSEKKKVNIKGRLKTKLINKNIIKVEIIHV